MLRWLLAVPLLLVAPLTWAAPQDNDDDLKKLVKEVADKDAAYQAAVRAATTLADRRAALTKRPNPADYADRLLALAEKSPNSPAAEDAVFWVAMNSARLPSGAKALDIVLAKYLGSEQMTRLVPLVPSFAGDPIARLRLIAEKSPSRDVQGSAKMAQAQLLLRQPGGAGQKDAETLLAEVVEKFGDVKATRGTLKDTATPLLFEIKHLGIGKTAPELSGEDIDGVKFKLSDYRGKVVVLDFWGHW